MIVIGTFPTYLSSVIFCEENLLLGVCIVEKGGKFLVVELPPLLGI